VYGWQSHPIGNVHVAVSARGQCTSGSLSQLAFYSQSSGGSVQVAVYKWQCQPRGSALVVVSVSAKGQCTGGSVGVSHGARVFRWQCTGGNVSQVAVYRWQCTRGSVSQWVVYRWPCQYQLWGCAQVAVYMWQSQPRVSVRWQSQPIGSLQVAVSVKWQFTGGSVQAAVSAKGQCTCGSI
jgi:hypothetical protein